MSSFLQSLPWLVAIAAVAVCVMLLLARRRPPSDTPAAQPLPADWNLAPRPVFSSDERRIYRQLREALPHHVILAKLPLVRFCQPNDPQELRYWYELLGSASVSFAICSPNGRVLAAIDIDTERAQPRRGAQIKQSVMDTCRIRYLHCTAERLPSPAELQLLVPHSGAARGPQPAPIAAPGDAAADRRAQRSALWQDSTLFQDSFFSRDGRDDSGPISNYGDLAPAPEVAKH